MKQLENLISGILCEAANKGDRYGDTAKSIVSLIQKHLLGEGLTVPFCTENTVTVAAGQPTSIFDRMKADKLRILNAQGAFASLESDYARLAQKYFEIEDKANGLEQSLNQSIKVIAVMRERIAELSGEE